MGFFSDFLGKGPAQRAEQAGQRAIERTNAGYDSADAAEKTGYTSATGRVQPLADTTGRAFNLFADSYGINGDDARQRAFQTYSADPFNQHSNALAQQQLGNIMRTAASRGMGNSGATQLAMSRAGLEAQDRRVADWRQGVGQFSGQAVPIASLLANMDQSYYGGVANRAIGRANALNTTDINATMAANNARMAGVNNVFKAIGGAAQLAMGMPPTALASPGTSPGGVQPGGTWGRPGQNPTNWLNPDAVIPPDDSFMYPSHR